MRSDNHSSSLEYAYLELADAVCRGEADGKAAERVIMKAVRHNAQHGKDGMSYALPESAPV